MKNKQKSSGKTPLLYIQQPSLKETKANMQQSYSSKNAKPKQVEKQKEQVTEKKPRKRKRSYFEEELGVLGSEAPVKETDKKETEAEQIESAKSEEFQKETESKKRTYSFKPLKSFRDMDLDEKVEYLSRYINGKAPFPCEFVTAEKRFKGILVKLEEDVLVVKTFQGEDEEINRASIKAINIIGL